MQFTFIFAWILFILSCLLFVLYLLGAVCKSVGMTTYGVVSTIFLLIVPVFCLIMTLDILVIAPHVWGISYIFIVMHLGWLFAQYMLCMGAAIFAKKNIYRMTAYGVFKRYSYHAVIGYVMKKDSSVVQGRFGPRKVVTYDTEIYFDDDTYASFSVSRETDRKIRHIRQRLEEHHCRRNGRPRNKKQGILKFK